ncbi:MAG: FAD-dependent oxidoreductase [Candidatus Omnitrophota bacterium]
MAKKKILILGAGLAGLSTAWHLQKKGISCRTFEKEPQAGGLCRTKSINGFLFDYDGHLLHFKHSYSFDLVKSLLGDNLVEHKRNAWVYSHRRFIPFPFQANIGALPVRIAKECREGFIQAQNNRRSQNKGNLSFLQWIENTFGAGIARHFMIPYNSKFWTLPPQKLTCEWLDGFITVPTLKQVIEGALGQTKRQLGYNARFWYPKKGGINQLALAFSAGLKNIHLNCSVVSIDLKKKEIKLNSGEIERFDNLISTLPLPELAKLIKVLPEDIRSEFRKLKWNSILNLNLGVEKKDASKRHWVYFPEKDLVFFRIGYFNNFSSSLAPKNKTSLYAEVSLHQDGGLQESKIIPCVKEGLAKVGVVSPADKILAADINYIKYGYPIYDQQYQAARSRILSYLQRNKVIPCGRYGSWQYLSMEGAILDGKRAADVVCKNPLQ